MLRVKMHQLDETIGNFIMNKMTIDLYMFGPLMKKKNQMQDELKFDYHKIKSAGKKIGT